jgi:hypothetical protein
MDNDGWILDDFELCVGAGFAGFNMVPYADPSALRFARLEDAQHFQAALPSANYRTMAERTHPVEYTQAISRKPVS